MNTVRKKCQVAGSTLKRKRRALSLKRADAARLLGITESCYKNWEQHGAGIEAIPFATGEWDKVIELLEGSSCGDFLESLGKIYRSLTDENQQNIVSELDQLSSSFLSRLIFQLKS